MSKKVLLTSNVVDVSFLNTHLSDNAEQLAAMISLFLKQTPEKIDLLKKSVSNKNYVLIKQSSHFLKSSFTIMGLSCKDTLIEIEQLSNNNKNIEKIKSLTSVVLNNYVNSTKEYERILSNLTSN